MVDKSPSDPLKETPRQKREVLVPVFLSVAVAADDDLEAEVSAVEVVRAAPSFRVGDSIVEVRSVIAPICKLES